MIHASSPEKLGALSTAHTRRAARKETSSAGCQRRDGVSAARDFSWLRKWLRYFLNLYFRMRRFSVHRFTQLNPIKRPANSAAVHSTAERPAVTCIALPVGASAVRTRSSRRNSPRLNPPVRSGPSSPETRHGRIVAGADREQRQPAEQRDDERSERHPPQQADKRLFGQSRKKPSTRRSSEPDRREQRADRHSVHGLSAGRRRTSPSASARRRAARSRPGMSTIRPAARDPG